MAAAAPATETWHVPGRVTNVASLRSASSESASSGEETSTRLEQVVLDVPVAPNTLIASVRLHEKCLQPMPSWDALQIDVDCWARFGGHILKLNHASGKNANTHIDVRVQENLVHIVSRIAISEGVALSFDYNTTEWSMAEPFDDWSTLGRIVVQGFSHASSDEQQRLLASGFVAPHIREMYEEVRKGVRTACARGRSPGEWERARDAHCGSS